MQGAFLCKMVDTSMLGSKLYLSRCVGKWTASVTKERTPSWTRSSRAGSSVRIVYSHHEPTPHAAVDDDESNFFVPTKRLKGKNYREAAEIAESSKKQAADVKPKKAAKSVVKKEAPAEPTIKKPAVSPRTGLAVEVVIPVRKSASGRAAPIEISDTEEESDAPKPRRRRIVRKTSIPSDDDDVSEEEIKPEAKRGAKKAPAKRSAKAKKVEDSDYEASSGGESESDAGSVAESSDEDVPRKAVKPKPKPKVASRKSKGNSSDATTPPMTEDSEAMSVDESSTTSTKAKPKAKAAPKKRKAEDDDARPAKKQKRREDTDPWKLRSPAVRRDWTQMRAPPLEMFHFARKVVDEYTYLDGKIHSMVTNVTAERHWVLSGTPPIHDFGALKTISAFLNLHLGVDDDGEGQSVQVKKRKREQTGEWVCRDVPRVG